MFFPLYKQPIPAPLCDWPIHEEIVLFHVNINQDEFLLLSKSLTCFPYCLGLRHFEIAALWILQEEPPVILFHVFHNVLGELLLDRLIGKYPCK
jgi:hypothetical protein